MDTVFYVIEILGVISFAISGALIAIDKETDFFGVVFLAVITTFGGGITRDLIIGNNPPSFFVAMPDLVPICIGTAIVVFVLAMLFKTKYVENEQLMIRINNVFDAAGISVFAVSGVRIAIDFCGENSNAILAIMMGMISAIGGGMLRDMILRDIPFVLCKHIYALATLAGSSVYYVLSVHILYGTEAGEVIAMVVGVVTVFVIRMVASYFNWNMPRAIVFSKLKSEEATVEEQKEEREAALIENK